MCVYESEIVCEKERLRDYVQEFVCVCLCEREIVCVHMCVCIQACVEMQVSICLNGKSCSPNKATRKKNKWKKK